MSEEAAALPFVFLAVVGFEGRVDQALGVAEKPSFVLLASSVVVEVKVGERSHLVSLEVELVHQIVERLDLHAEDLIELIRLELIEKLVVLKLL